MSNFLSRLSSLVSPPRRVLGLDIGESRVCAVVAEAMPGGEIAILGAGSSPSRGMVDGSIVNLAEAARAVGDACHAARETAGVQPKACVVGISGDVITGVSLETTVDVATPMRGITERDCREACAEALKSRLDYRRRLLHLFPNEYHVDGQRSITNPIGLAGRRLRVRLYAIMASVRPLSLIRQCVRRAGLRVHDIVAQPLAAGMAVLTPGEREFGVALVDLAESATMIAIFRNNMIQHMDRFRMGDDNICLDVAQVLRCSFLEAMALRRKHGHAVPWEVGVGEQVEVPALKNGGEARKISRLKLSEIIAARAEEILGEVQKSIHRSGNSDFLHSGVVLTGSVATLEGIAHAAERILERRCRIGRMEGLSDMAEAIGSPAYAASAGLIYWYSREYFAGRFPRRLRPQ